jgi:co-chaperonin GroES (HSP10)
MNIKPFNRYLLVSPVEEKTKEDPLALVLPTDYQRPANPHVMCEVRDVAKDSKFYDSIASGDSIIVERRMLNKIDFDGKTSYLVLENYIYGRIDNETNKR